MGRGHYRPDLFTVASVLHHYRQILAANELTSKRQQLESPHFFLTGGSSDVLSILIDVSVKSNGRRRKRSLLPAYLYLLGLLLTDTQSKLELGLVVHLHSRRWLGSSREFIVLLYYGFVFLGWAFFVCHVKASEEHWP